MPTLHIEHEITGFAQWKAAFDRFADMRRGAGVRGHTIRRPASDPQYVVIDLDFDTVEAAQAFLDVLGERVWSSRDNAPALVGTPQARVLEVAESQETYAPRADHGTADAS